MALELRRGGGRTGGSMDSERGGAGRGVEGRFAFLFRFPLAECGEGAVGGDAGQGRWVRLAVTWVARVPRMDGPTELEEECR